MDSAREAISLLQIIHLEFDFLTLLPPTTTINAVLNQQTITTPKIKLSQLTLPTFNGNITEWK